MNHPIVTLLAANPPDKVDVWSGPHECRTFCMIQIHDHDDPYKLADDLRNMMNKLTPLAHNIVSVGTRGEVVWRHWPNISEILDHIFQTYVDIHQCQLELLE